MAACLAEDSALVQFDSPGQILPAGVFGIQHAGEFAKPLIPGFDRGASLTQCRRQPAVLSVLAKVRQVHCDRQAHEIGPRPAARQVPVAMSVTQVDRPSGPEVRLGEVDARLHRGNPGIGSTHRRMLRHRQPERLQFRWLRPARKFLRDGPPCVNANPAREDAHRLHVLAIDLQQAVVDPAQLELGQQHVLLVLAPHRIQRPGYSYHVVEKRP